MEIFYGESSCFVGSESTSDDDSSTYQSSAYESDASSSCDFGDKENDQIAITSLQELPKPIITLPPDPFQYVSPIFYSFNEKSYNLMRIAIQSNTSITLQELQACDLRRTHDLKIWRKIKDNLSLEQNENGLYCLYLRSSPKLKISYIEKWESIVQECHKEEGGAVHLEFDATLQRIKSTWCVDIRRQGIPLAFVKDVLQFCECAKWKESHNGSQLISKKKNTLTLEHAQNVSMSHVQEALIKIMIDFKVRLVMVRSTKNHSGSTTIIDYACHRGRSPCRVGTKKRLRKSKRCGCPFQVRVQYANCKNIASISLYPIHEGHTPGTREDLYYLPVHPDVLQCCMEDLFDVGTSRHVAKMSRSKEILQYERASCIDQVTYRFFMLQREVSMMSYQIRKQGMFMHFCFWICVYIYIFSRLKDFV